LLAAPSQDAAEIRQTLSGEFPMAKFLHELGRDFCFIGRQFRITVVGRHHYLDLLFYHRALRCLIALDLKLGAFQHQYAGQMNFYLNYLKERVSHPDKNPPVGDGSAAFRLRLSGRIAIFAGRGDADFVVLPNDHAGIGDGHDRLYVA
jgi:hypothetical protein